MKTPLKISRQLGIAIADDLFKTFQKPGFRGKNFRWNDFHNLVSNFAKSRVGLSVREWDNLNEKQRDKLEQTVAKVAERRAKQLLLESPQIDDHL